MIGDDHPLGREHRAVDQAVLSGLREIVGEEALQAGERARPLDPEDRGLAGDDGRAMAQPLQAIGVVGELGEGHGGSIDGRMGMAWADGRMAVGGGRCGSRERRPSAHPPIRPSDKRPPSAYDRSSSSTGCITGIVMPAARRPAPICIRHPGFPVATASSGGSAARKVVILSASTRWERSGWTSE